MMLDDRLQRVFDDLFPDAEIEIADTTTSDDIEGWDSLMHINLMFRVEQEFGVQFQGDEMGALSDVGALKQLLRAKGCG